MLNTRCAQFTLELWACAADKNVNTESSGAGVDRNHWWDNVPASAFIFSMALHHTLCVSLNHHQFDGEKVCLEVGDKNASFTADLILFDFDCAPLNIPIWT